MTANYKTFFKNRGDHKPAGSSQGYPVAGPQSPTSDEIAGKAFFAHAGDWETIVNTRYDFIVIGTGPTGVAFIEQALSNNPHVRILVLERGGFWLPAHYQMLPAAFQSTTGSPLTTYPWSRTTAMATTGMEMFQAGYIPVLGGRSTYWSAWCPSPKPDQMRDWPQEVIDLTESSCFWQRAKRFLHVTSTDTIKDGVYGNLQAQLDLNLKENFRKFVPSADNAFPAPIAVANPDWKTVRFYKYSTVGTLLDLHEKHAALAKSGGDSTLAIVDRCIVNRLLHDGDGTVIAIDTSRGTLNVGAAKIVLAMGTIPPTTLLMNSFKEQLPNAGKRYTGHFMSHITARVKRSAFEDLSALEIGATYLDGRDEEGHQYHVQTSAFAVSNPVADIGTIAHEYPDGAAAPTMQQLMGSEDHVLFVCATLGEISENNPDNWVRRNGEADPTTNINLQLIPGASDQRLWKVLDEASYQTIEAMATNRTRPEIEYWIDTPDGGGFWSTSRPDQQQVRLNIIVHEASTLWMGTDPHTSVVGTDYRPHGIHNVYVTGGSLFPTCGSWNPTLTMCGLAQDLADRLTV